MKRNVLIMAIVGLEGLAALLALLVFLCTVGMAAMPWVERFIYWLLGLFGY